MSCMKIQELLSADIDNELSEEENSLISDHLIKCQECLDYHQKLKLISSVFSDVPLQESPENLTGDIMKVILEDKKIVKIKTKDNKKSYISWRWRQLAAGLAIFFISLSVGLIPLITHNLALQNPLEFSESDSQDDSIAASENLGIGIRSFKNVDEDSSAQLDSEAAVMSIKEQTNSSEEEFMEEEFMEEEFMENAIQPEDALEVEGYSAEVFSVQSITEQDDTKSFVEIVGKFNLFVAFSGSMLGVFLIWRAKQNKI